jgi:hypothetical protein
MIVNEIEVINKIAKAISVSDYPYSGPALVCLPDKTQITRDEYWSRLNENEKEKFLQYAYAAYITMADYGIEYIIVSATQNYLDEK